MQTEFVCCRNYRCIAEPLPLANKDKAQDDEGKTALMRASGKGHHVCVDFLLKAGADKDAKDNEGTTALMSASDKGHHVCADFLLKAGANQDIQDVTGLTALSYAAASGNQACIKLLQQAGAVCGNGAMGLHLDELEEEKAGKTKKNKRKKHKKKKTSFSSLPNQGHGLGGGGWVTPIHIHTYYTDYTRTT